MQETARIQILTAVLATALFALAAPAGVLHGYGGGEHGRAAAIGIGLAATPTATASPVQVSGIGWD